MTTKKADERTKVRDVTEGFSLIFKASKHLLKYWKIQLAILILGNLSMLIGLINPYIGKLILDNAILAKDIKALVAFSIIAGVIFVISLALSSVHDYLANYGVARLQIDLNRKVFNQLKRGKLSYLRSLSPGETLFRITNDITSASSIINVSLIHFINSIAKIIFVTAIIIFLNPVLLLIVLAYQVVTLIRTRYLAKPLQRFRESILSQQETIYMKLNNFFERVYLFKAFGRLNAQANDYLRRLLDLVRLNLRFARFNIFINSGLGIFDKLFFGLVSFFGAILVIRGAISLGTLGAGLMYLGQGVGAYSVLVSTLEEIVLNRVSLSRLANLLEKPEQEPVLRGNFKPIDIRRISFSNVSFGYEERRDIIKDLSFTIEPGEKLAIAGPSGCGKTTLVSLILGLYPAKKGIITVSGKNILEIDEKYFLDNTGLALQEPFLYQASIRDNIKFARTEANEQELIRATELSDIYELIKSLPKGFDTMAGEDAYRFSQGQKQRLAIARALIKKPQLIIFDEAMSSLDPESEARIISNVKEAFPESGFILVSHRYSAVLKMDKVLFFYDNKVLKGTHEQLAKNQEYLKFFKINDHKTGPC